MNGSSLYHCPQQNLILCNARNIRPECYITSLKVFAGCISPLPQQPVRVEWRCTLLVGIVQSDSRSGIHCQLVNAMCARYYVHS